MVHPTHFSSFSLEHRLLPPRLTFPCYLLQSCFRHSQSYFRNPVSPWPFDPSSNQSNIRGVPFQHHYGPPIDGEFTSGEQLRPLADSFLPSTELIRFYSCQPRRFLSASTTIASGPSPVLASLAKCHSCLFLPQLHP